MKLLVISLLCGTVFSYPQQYPEEIEAQDFEQSIKEPKRAIYAEHSNGKVLKAIKVLPHYAVSQNQNQDADSAPIFSGSTPIPIIRYDRSQSLDGSYKHSFETGNNIIAEETGFIKNIGVKDQEALVQHGSFKYTAPDGSIIFTEYTADEGGFRVKGDHIPTPPPIPEEIQKALETIYEGIRLQQEEEAREAKSGKQRPIVLQEQISNSVTDNYSSQYSQ